MRPHGDNTSILNLITASTKESEIRFTMIRRTLVHLDLFLKSTFAEGGGLVSFTQCNHEMPRASCTFCYHPATPQQTNKHKHCHKISGLQRNMYALRVCLARTQLIHSAHSPIITCLKPTIPSVHYSPTLAGERKKL